MKLTHRTTAWATLGVVLLFLVGPFIVIIAVSVSTGDTLAFPPRGFTLRWYALVFELESFRASFWLSLWLAVLGTGMALVLGIPVAYAMVRYRLPGAGALRLLVTTPLIVPGIIVGLALLRHFVIPYGIGVSLALFVAHSALVLPYAVRVVTASLDNLGADIEEAAVLLGCTRVQAFSRVVLPNIQGGILAAFILGFVTSFNQVPVSLFLSGPGVRTLPIDMLWYIEYTYDPSVAALASLLAVMSILIVFSAERFLGLSRYV